MTDIIFVCTGNSCRSQMAEGWARSMGQGHRIASAGIESHGLNPRAVSVMQEAGVDISHQVSERLDDISLETFDVVVTVCSDADENCPVLPHGVRKLHWPLEDPASLSGSEEEIMQGFRRTRDLIHDLVRQLFADLQS